MIKQLMYLFLLAPSLIFAQVGTQIFTTSGTFIVPQGITTLTVIAIGAGGSGGGNGSGGGGGGGCSRGTITVTPGSSIPVTIGSPGVSPAVGTTSFSSFLGATGGANGVQVSNPNIGGGGAGGSGWGGNLGNWQGGAGGGGYYTYFGGGGGGAAGPGGNGSAGGNTITWTGICMTPGGAGGMAGPSPAGSGGKGAGFTDAACNVTDPAANGSVFGGGGGGGNGNGGGPGTGSPGYCEVIYSNCTTPSAPVDLTPQNALSLCAGSTTTLMVSGSGTLTWYSSPTSSTSIGTGTSLVVNPTLTSTYYAEANTCNSSTRTPITVTVNAVPSVSATAASSVVCQGFPATLTASGANTYSWSSNASGTTVVVFPNLTTTYTVVGTTTAMCSSTATVIQQVAPLPSVTLTASSPTLCAGQSVTITASGATSYSWTGGFTTAVVVFTPTATTRYHVSAYNAPNCFDTTSVRIQVINCSTPTGIYGSAIPVNGFDIWPNPSRGAITILATQDMLISLRDVAGRLIMEVQLDAAHGRQFHLENMKPGIYFISGNAGGLSLTRKLIVEH